MLKRLPCPLLLALLTTACVGVRKIGDTETVHAESFNLFGLSIPGDDYDAAWARVPAGAEVTTVRSTPNDWTSVAGVLNKLFGFGQTEISWTDPQGRRMDQGH